MPIHLRRQRRVFGDFYIISLQLVLLFSQGVNGSWWMISRIQLSSAHMDIIAQCRNIPGLVRKQILICEKNPDLLRSLGRGAKMGISECQTQFKFQRWNCSTVDTGSSVFGNVMLKVGSRESAFLYAISSAGVTHAVTKGCSKGEIENCECDPNKRGVGYDSQGQFTWSGCSEFINYGVKFARKFIDAREGKRTDSRAIMNLHNNRAGRKAVQKHTKKMCKCHGVSGSCAVRTCWIALMEFRAVGRYLKKKYDGAVQVVMAQRYIESKSGIKPFSKSDLIYFEDSPDYCFMDKSVGTLGTGGRECKKNAMDASSCDIMCCGRGYDTRRVEVVKQCNCKFKWCCYVECEECKKMKDIHTCKMTNS